MAIPPAEQRGRIVASEVSLASKGESRNLSAEPVSANKLCITNAFAVTTSGKAWEEAI